MPAGIRHCHCWYSFLVRQSSSHLVVPMFTACRWYHMSSKCFDVGSSIVQQRPIHLCRLRSSPPFSTCTQRYLPSAVYIAWGDVTESMTTIRSPFCGWKVKFSHTRYRALDPELIPVYRQSARRWREVNHAIDLAVGCHYFLPCLRLPS